MDAIKQIEFSAAGYRWLLDAVTENGYRYLAFDDEQRFGPEKVCLLRHDVDSDLGRALELARIESELDIRATYFLMIRSPIYNLFSRANSAMAEEIASLGHWIGLHHDPNFSPRSLSMEKAVALEAGFLSRMFDQQVRAVSFHQPTRQFLEQMPALDGFVNTYSDTDLEGFDYLSDSNREWRSPPGEFIADSGRTKLQLLTHPMWWAAGPSEQSSEQTWDAVLEAKFDLMQDQLCETERGYGPRRKIEITGGAV